MGRTFFALYIVVALNSSSSVVIFYANISCMKQLMNGIIILSEISQIWLVITNFETDKLIWIHLMLYNSILTNNPHMWSTNFYCFISPCINNTVVYEWRTWVWDFFTAFPCSCFVPFIDILRTWFHSFSCFSWIIAISRIPKNL